MQQKARVLMLAIILTLGLGFQTSFSYAETTSPQEIDVSPKNVKASSVKYDTIKLSWSAVKGVDNYKVYKSDDKNKWVHVDTTSSKSITISKLPCQKTKYYKVVSNVKDNQAATLASSAIGKSSSSKLNIEKESEVVAGKPLMDATSVNGHMLSVKKGKLSWKKVSGAQGYRIYKYDKESKSYKRIKSVKGGSKTSTKINLTKGQTNSFKVSAYRESENTTVVAKKSSTKGIKVPTVLKKSTPGFSKTNAGKVIAKAKTKVGKRYVSGAAGPNQFDCSGYAWWVYKNSNASSKKFTRSSAQGEYNQLKNYNIGKNLCKAQPGDLVFFSNGGSKNGIYHVALYYGDNELIHATNPRQGVRVTPVKWYGANNVAAIVRLPNM